MPIYFQGHPVPALTKRSNMYINSNMPWLIDRLGLFPIATLAVVITAVFTYWLLNKSAVSGWFKGSEEIVPPYLSISALLFGLFAATLASDIWPKQDEANRVLVNEASAIRSLLATSGHLQSADRNRLTQSVNGYVTAVLDREWPSMVAGDYANKEGALNELKALSETVIEIGSRERLPRILESRLQNSVDDIRTARVSRLSLAYDNISFIKWRSVLLFGLLLIFTVGIVHLRRPRAMKISLSLTAFGILLTIGILVNNRSPYAGPDAIMPSMLVDSTKAYEPGR